MCKRLCVHVFIIVSTCAKLNINGIDSDWLIFLIANINSGTLEMC